MSFLETLNDSDVQRTPPCKYFDQIIPKCGGCSLQHIPYELQVLKKQNFVREATGFQDVTAHFGDELHYRNRVDMVFLERGLGFKRKGSFENKILIDECKIATTKINKINYEIRSFFNDKIYSFDQRAKRGVFHHALIRSTTNESAVSFVVNQEDPEISKAKDKVLIYASLTKLVDHIIFTKISPDSGTTISDNYELILGEHFIKEILYNNEFIFPIQGFFQNNLAVTELIHKYVATILDKYDTSRYHLLDLFGGVGTFGIIHGKRFKRTTLIELLSSLVECAKINASKNNFDGLEAIELDAKQVLAFRFEKPLAIITDPPRSGMHPKTIRAINELKPQLFIYVCCNPALLKTELPQFNDNYEIKSVAMFDMFPQTQHMEAVIEMRRRS